MSLPYIGEIRMFAGSFAPVGWMFCDGSILSITANETLFNLIGTTYGGDGQSTFALPDLRGRVPIHQGSGHVIGAFGGTETVTLSGSQVPPHSHSVLASGLLASAGTPTGNVVAAIASATAKAYATATAATPMASAAVSTVGAATPHENRMPYLAINYIICLDGIFPSPN